MFHAMLIIQKPTFFIEKSNTKAPPLSPTLHQSHFEKKISLPNQVYVLSIFSIFLEQKKSPFA